MANNQLNVVAESSPSSQARPIPSRLTRRRELQAKFERLWLLDPDQFNPLRNCMQKERLTRTYQLLSKHMELNAKKVVDLGCAAGIFSRMMRDAGTSVDAVDIAENALKELKKQNMANIEAKHDAMPDTKLIDHDYDVVLCMEIIADLTKDDYRLFFSELARLVKRDGVVICSTPIDFKTDGGVERLFELAQTEFDIIDAKPSYHALFIRLKAFFEAPANFIAGSQDESLRKKETERRHGFKRFWYAINSRAPLIWIWQLLNPLTKPVLNWFKNSSWLLLKLESLCEFFQHDSGISHIIFLAKLRPLMQVDPNEIPTEKRHKKEVWE